MTHGTAKRENYEHCPHCNANLQGEPIPRESQEAYGATHFSRKVALYSRERDRTEGWRCPDCGGEWLR
jgi:Zn-finger nucleic acid-binding protein